MIGWNWKLLTKRFRWTTRRLIAAVVVVALLLGVAILSERRKQFHHRALRHEVLSGIYTHGHVHFGADPDLARYHEAMRAKYSQAADRPWQSVEPDPPLPPKKPSTLEVP
jgi:hypothetical protein